MSDRPDPAPAAMPAARNRNVLGWVLLLVVLAVLGTGLYLLRAPALREWQRRHGMREPEAAQRADAITTPMTAREPAPGDAAANDAATGDAAGGTSARMAAMQAELATLKAGLAAEQARVTTLEGKVAGLEARPVGPAPAGSAAAGVAMAANDPVASALAGKLDALSARADRMDATLTTNSAALRAAQATLSATATRVSEAARQQTKLARLDRLLAAEVALRAGRPVGRIDGAPPALARFADAAPPTETDLRLRFPALAEEARAASDQGPETGGFWRRVRRHLLSLVTLQHDGKLVVGRAAMATMDEARQALAAGDLAAAADRIASLPPPEAKVFADWLTAARAVVAARAALAQMIGNA